MLLTCCQLSRVHSQWLGCRGVVFRWKEETRHFLVTGQNWVRRELCFLFGRDLGLDCLALLRQRRALEERGGLGTRVGTPGTSARHGTRPSLPGAQGSLPPLHFPSALGRVGPGPGPLPPCSECFTCRPALFTQTLCLPAVSFWKHTAHSHCVGWRGG